MSALAHDMKKAVRRLDLFTEPPKVIERLSMRRKAR